MGIGQIGSLGLPLEERQEREKYRLAGVDFWHLRRLKLGPFGHTRSVTWQIGPASEVRRVKEEESKEPIRIFAAAEK